MAPWQEEFVEQVGLVLDVGLPRSVSRVFGWLVVCEPRHQSAEQLQATLKLSAGSVSAAVRTLARSGIVTRVTFTGERRIYYQLRPDAWPRLLRSRQEVFTQVRRAAEHALLAGAAAGIAAGACDATGVGDRSDERLRGMRDFFAHLESIFGEIVEPPVEASSKSRR